MKKNQKGVIGEYLTCIEKIKENKWVFTSIDPQSPCDLITLDKDGNIELIDVKTKTFRHKDYVSKTDGYKTKTYRKRDYICKLGYKRNTTGSAISRNPTKIQKKLNIKLLMRDYKE